MNFCYHIFPFDIDALVKHRHEMQTFQVGGWWASPTLIQPSSMVRAV
jgi:hypothetical protein